MLYYIIKECEWCHKVFEQRAGNTIGRRTCSSACRRVLKQYTITHTSMRANVKGKLKVSLNPAKLEVAKMREDNADVFTYPALSDSFNYTHEEVSELFRYAQRMVASGHLRGNELPDEIENGKHIEWGDALMMLFTVAIQMDIDPDKAFYSSIAKIYQRCERKRQELANER